MGVYTELLLFVTFWMVVRVWIRQQNHEWRAGWSVPRREPWPNPWLRRIARSSGYDVDAALEAYRRGQEKQQGDGHQSAD